MSHNCLDQLDSATVFQLPVTLTSLNFENNQLAAVPAGLTRLTRLQDLDLSSNAFVGVSVVNGGKPAMSEVVLTTVPWADACSPSNAGAA